MEFFAGGPAVSLSPEKYTWPYHNIACEMKHKIGSIPGSQAQLTSLWTAAASLSACLSRLAVYF